MNCNRVKTASAANSLQVYLKEIREESLLSAGEECELADAIARGDKDARTRMIQANLRLVVKIARDYVGRGMALEDLIGEGNLGLIRATEEFQPRFGTRFSTYASYWIKQSIRHSLINTSTTIRLPAHMIGLLTKWRRAERSLCRQLGRGPGFNEVAQALGLTEAQKMLVAKAHQARQLKLENNITAPARRGLSWGSMGHFTPTDAMLESDDEYRILLGRLSRLEPRERTILILRYGLEGETAQTLKEIGRRLGVTREWVRKIEIRAVRKLHSEYAADTSGQPARSGSSSFRAAFRVIANRRQHPQRDCFGLDRIEAEGQNAIDLAAAFNPPRRVAVTGCFVGSLTSVHDFRPSQQSAGVCASLPAWVGNDDDLVSGRLVTCGFRSADASISLTSWDLQQR